jgi:hypothetical protein
MARFETQSPNLKTDYLGSVTVTEPNGTPSSAYAGLAAPSQGDVLIVTMSVGDDQPGQGASADFVIWLYRQDADVWVLWSDPPVNGVIPVSSAAVEEVRGYIVFADRIYVEVRNPSRHFAQGTAHVWTKTERGL